MMDRMPDGPKGYWLTPMDFAESGTDPTLRPLDECLRLEQDFLGRGSDHRRLKSYRRLRQLAGEVQFHTDPQDTECEAWRRMLEPYHQMCPGVTGHRDNAPRGTSRRSREPDTFRAGREPRAQGQPPPRRAFISLSGRCNVARYGRRTCEVE